MYSNLYERKRERTREFGIYPFISHIVFDSYVRCRSLRLPHSRRHATRVVIDKIHKHKWRTMMWCSHSSMEHREADIIHWIVSSAEQRQRVYLIYVYVCVCGTLALANCQENSRRFIYLCQFQTQLFFRCAHSVCVGCLFFLWLLSLSSLVHWLCRLLFSLYYFQMPTFSWHHTWATSVQYVRSVCCACVDSRHKHSFFIGLAMRVIDSLVLYFLFFFSLRQSCSNIGSGLQTVFSPFRLRMCYTLRRDLDLAWHRISGNVISMPRHSAKYIAEIFIDKRTIACVSPIHTHKVVRGCGDEDAECVLVVRVLGSSLRRRRRRQFLYLNFYRIHLDGMAKCHRNSLTNNQKQCWLIVSESGFFFLWLPLPRYATLPQCQSANPLRHSFAQAERSSTITVYTWHIFLAINTGIAGYPFFIQSIFSCFLYYCIGCTYS